MCAALKGPCHQKLYVSNVRDHYDMVLFPPNLKKKKGIDNFSEILEIVCDSELGIGKEKSISKVRTGQLEF